MRHFQEEWIQQWCQENGWTDLILERNQYWAFPPGAVIPEPIPTKTLRIIKAEKGLSREERFWSIAALLGTITALAATCFCKSPMPLFFAFAWDAITVSAFES